MSQDILRTKVLVVGSGPAGYTAAIYAARSNLAPILFSGYEPGGQLSLTKDVENFPGFADPVMGPDLMEAMRKQALNVGTEIHMEEITSLNCAQAPFEATSSSNKKIVADTVILATGAQAKWLEVPGESELLGKGVSSCATCDGFFFKGAPNVCVVGGGNTAVEEALHLAGLAQKVTLIHRRDTLRATPVLQDRLFAQKNIEVVWNATVQSINTEDSKLASVTLKTSEGEQNLATKAVFVAIGHSPSTKLVRSQLRCDEYGYILIEKNQTETSVPGIFAAGDVQDTVFRQAITAAGSGCMAALEAERFLHESSQT